MPYGPGKFEEEPPSTFFLYRLSVEGMMHETHGGHSKWSGRYFPDKTLIVEANEAGFTWGEIVDSLADMNEMAGAVLFEDEQGFAYAQIFGPEEALQLDERWEAILKEDE